MKKSIIKKIGFLGIVMFLYSQSCDTKLEEEVFDTLTEKNFLKTPEELNAAVGAAYSSFAGMGNHGNMWSVQELSSDELVVATKGGDWYDGGVLIQLHQHTFAPDNGFFNGTWTQIYGGIGTCNRLISQFAGKDDIINELRAIRAIWYFWALDIFGNIPIAKDFVADGQNPPGTSSRAEVYKFLEAELLAVLDKVTKDKNDATYGRVTHWVIRTVLCKLYLNAEEYTGTAQWAKAEEQADAIIAGGKYSLASVYASNFTIDNKGSTENIFVYPYDKVFAKGFNWPMMALHYSSQNTYKFTAQPWNGYAAIEEFYNSYVDPTKNPGTQGKVWKGKALAQVDGTLDSRLSNFIVGPQYNADGTRTTDDGFEASDPDGKPLTYTPENTGGIYPAGLRQAGARIGKYQYEVGGTDNMSNDFVIFRYADVVLAAAEAKGRQGKLAEALVLINQLRTRAGVTPFTANDVASPQAALDKLYDERGREMFAEMTRRQDMIRFGKFETIAWEAKSGHTLTKDWRLFPIPKPQLEANPKLTQNPGYK